jgi:hypothetical protein
MAIQAFLGTRDSRMLADGVRGRGACRLAQRVQMTVAIQLSGCPKYGERVPLPACFVQQDRKHLRASF